VMAKGSEDTLLYVYNRLLSLNEVGGSPERFGTTEEEFHGFNFERAMAFPCTMNATSTHDGKRGEDVRARINVLSEIPHEWQSRLERWSDINEEKRKLVSGRRIPSRNDEYLLYQTLLGSHPFTEAELDEYDERVARYLRKVTREAKVHTRDRDSGRIYEDGFVDFAARILDRSGANPFLDDFEPFQRKIAHYGALNSLSQTLLKICSPGVPDFYQGSEVWDLSLVDPDNRRPVDFGARARLLEDVLRASQGDMAAFMRDAMADIGDGRIKLFLVQRALAARRDNAYLFEKAGYQGLEATGEHAGHVLAFARLQAGSCAVCVVPRYLTGVVAEGEFPLGPEVWGDTSVLLPVGVSTRWKCAISGRHILGTDRIMVGDALSLFPVSLLLEDSK
jgi:(1->4)-alpha-D-glucan 1-alpha-D-glucosylmutase